MKLKISYKGCTTPFREQQKRALTRIEREVGGPGAQLSKRTSTSESSLRNRCLTGPQLAASLNGTRKVNVHSEEATPGCWPSRQSGKEKPYLRLANKRKRLIWAKEHRHWTEEDWNKVLWTDESKFEVFGSHRRKDSGCHLSSMVEVM